MQLNDASFVQVPEFTDCSLDKWSVASLFIENSGQKISGNFHDKSMGTANLVTDMQSCQQDEGPSASHVPVSRIPTKHTEIQKLPSGSE